MTKLKNKTTRDSTATAYLAVWHQFNSFLIKLDKKPKTWEERITLFAVYQIDKGIQSNTLKSYYSAIKNTLRLDDYYVDDTKVLLNSLAKACRLVNDKVKNTLPIRKKLLELILFEIQRKFNTQPYLEIMYKTLFSLAYYGLFRVGELTTGAHPIKACNVHIAQNKEKLMILLYSSKMHGKESRPQKVKIVANSYYKTCESANIFCPFQLSRQYLTARGDYYSDSEPFFIYRDQEPVMPSHVRSVLKDVLEDMNLCPDNYVFHGFRSGRSMDLISYGYSIDQVKTAGRWRSNVVYKYIKSFEL